MDFFRRVVLLLVGVTLPFEYTLLGTVVGFPVTPNKAVAALLLVYVALEWAAGRRRPPPDPKRLWILFFAVTMVISCLPSYAGGVPLSRLADLMVTQGTLILFYVVLTYTVRRRADLDLLLLSFVVGCVLAAASGWLGYGLQVEGGRYEERLAGEGSSPNLLAFNLIVAIPAAASLMFTTRRDWAKPLYFAAIGVMIVACLSTLSRTAFVALPAMVAFWAFRFRRFSLLRYAAPVFLLVVAAAIFAPERVVLRARDVVNAAQERSLEELDPSARDRFLMVPGMARAFASNPLIGVGLSHYRWWAFKRGEVAHGIHNAYLQVLVEQGLVGFVPFVAILVLTWRTYTAASRTLRRRGDAELGILGFRAALLQAALTGALVMGLAQPSGRHKVFWLLFAMSTILIALVRERVRALESPAESAPSHPGLSAGSYGEWVPRPAS